MKKRLAVIAVLSALALPVLAASSQEQQATYVWHWGSEVVSYEENQLVEVSVFEVTDVAIQDIETNDVNDIGW